MSFFSRRISPERGEPKTAAAMVLGEPAVSGATWLGEDGEELTDGEELSPESDDWA